MRTSFSNRSERSPGHGSHPGGRPDVGRLRRILVWGLLAAIVLIPLAVAAASPFLAWRGPIYIAAGFAGISAMALLLFQPLLIGGYLPGAEGARGRRLHGLVGGALLGAVALHVGGLWLTSPPDVIDALLFAAPTWFSHFGVAAMWALLVAAGLAFFHRRLHLRAKSWRRVHIALALIAVVGSVVHALPIEGTMEIFSKAALCLAVVLASGILLAGRLRRRR